MRFLDSYDCQFPAAYRASGSSTSVHEPTAIPVHIPVYLRPRGCATIWAMQPFDYARATTIDAAAALLQQAQGRARVLAGGTDLLVALRERRQSTDLVVDVKSIAELTALRYDDETGLRI